MNKQEQVWAGSFGNEYNDRNLDLVANNLFFFANALQHVSSPIESILELCCGTGQNLSALKKMFPQSKIEGVDINTAACIKATAYGHIHNKSVYEFRPQQEYDLVISKGAAIHQSPENIDKYYKKLLDCSGKYILMAEYFSPREEEILYRGESGMMWRRDHIRDMLARNTEVVSSYFASKDHPNWPQDDLTCVLLKKI